MQPCPEGPASHLTNEDRREDDVTPARPSDTDWQVARFQHRELVAKGQRQQFVASALSATSDTRPVSTSVRLQLGTLLVRAGQRLQGAQAITRNSLGSVAGSARGAIA